MSSRLRITEPVECLSMVPTYWCRTCQAPCTVDHGVVVRPAPVNISDVMRPSPPAHRVVRAVQLVVVLGDVELDIEAEQ